MGKKSGGGFVAKVMKSQQDYKSHCPVCGEAITLVKHIEAVTDPENNALSFKEKMTKVCKCNRSELYK